MNTERLMRIAHRVASERRTYWKATSNPETFTTPGFLTSDRSAVIPYLGAEMGESWPDAPGYVMEVSIPIDKLVAIDGTMDVGASSLGIEPGYYMTGGDKHSQAGDPLGTVVWNEPIQMRLVGAYWAPANIVPRTWGQSASELIEGGRLMSDWNSGQWSIEDKPQDNVVEKWESDGGSQW